MNFYDLFINMCIQKNVKPSVAANEIGISKSNVSNWKRRNTFPTDSNLKKIADYFDVSVDYLLGNEPKESPAADSDEALMFALYGGDNKDITPEMLNDVRKFAQFIRDKERSKSNEA